MVRFDPPSPRGATGPLNTAQVLAGAARDLVLKLKKENLRIGGLTSAKFIFASKNACGTK